MTIKYIDQETFYNDFLSLIVELECGQHYNPANKQHVTWLKRRIDAFYAGCGTAIGLYSDDDEPRGMLSG
jgi:hypothetical protein